jgi:hypothetical protein
MSSISAGLSDGTALVSTGDTTGELVLKTNGGTTAVTIGTDQSVTFAAGVVTTSPTVLPAGTASAPALTTTGDTNTGLFFPAADTIAFSEGGAEAMRIDSSANVGIGTSLPQGKLDVSDGSSATTAGELVVDTANRTVYVGRLSTSGGTGSSFIVRGRLGVEIIKVDANAGTFTTNVGLAFPATQVASADANTLDDYEEGTFTPVPTRDGTAAVLTTTSLDGRYTKVGRIVVANIRLQINTISNAGTGNTVITGLPFASTEPTYSGLGIFGYNDALVNTIYAAWTSSTTIFFRSGTRGSGNDGGGWSAGGYLNLTMVYTTS